MSDDDTQDVWRSECCNAPVVMVRSDTSVFDYFDQTDTDELRDELEEHGVGAGSEFWMNDYVRVYHDACAACRNFIGDPWIESDESRIGRIEAENSELREALTSLVAAKNEKDKRGDTFRYRAMKEGVWDRAREVLAKHGKEGA